MKKHLHASQLLICQVFDQDKPEACVFLMEKNTGDTGFVRISEPFRALVGRKGVAYTSESCSKKKQEGDLCSPCGIFPITNAFGKEEHLLKASLSLDTFITHENLRYVDDPDSIYYNRCVDIRDFKELPFKSAERMLRHEDEMYDLGLVIGYNENPCIPKAGSCIFIHSWKNPDEPSAGCIVLDKESLLQIAKRLKKNLSPSVMIAPKEAMLELSREYSLHIPDLFS